MKPSARASFVALSALLFLLVLAPSAALATTTADQSGLKIDWHQANFSGLGRPQGFPAGAFAKGTYVVSSFTDNGGRIWASSDALNWSVVWRGENPPYYIVPGGPGFVAWSSSGLSLSKNGHKWNHVSQGVPQRLLNSDFTRLGSVGGTVDAFPDSGHGYWSVDGHVWNAIAPGSGPQGPITLAGDATHLWAFTGGKNFDANTTVPVQVWVTTDGHNWTKSAQLPNSQHVSGLSAAFGPLGGVAIGGARTWYSSDDVHWHLSTNTPTRTRQEGSVFVNAVVADESGFIVAAQHDPPGCALDPTQIRALTWTSIDGNVWRKMSSTGFLGKEIDQLFIGGRTLYGVGVDWNNDGSSSGAEWRAQLPHVAADNAPPPDPVGKPGPEGCGGP